MMKHFLKGAAAVLITMVVNIIVNMICNMRGIDLNTTVTTVVSTFCAILIYQGLTRNEKNKEL
ncbi:MAG: hypothetical protein K2J67_02135 [Lachnospiraceae bacterium]|nr:hypothetical protein [Lachnospiraceae bacterium]